MNKPKILVAGYGAWAKAQANPAGKIARGMNARDWDSCEVTGLELPVDSSALEARIGDLLDTHKPDAWIGVGVSSAAMVQAEMVGINWLDFDVPDVTGRTIVSKRISPNGPAAFEATLPNDQIVAAIKQAGIPAALSFHAGTHLCNQMLYSTARLITARGLNTLSGFIHVPKTPENILADQGAASHKPSMSLPLSREALRQCIETTANVLNERHAKSLERTET